MDPLGTNMCKVTVTAFVPLFLRVYIESINFNATKSESTNKKS